MLRPFCRVRRRSTGLISIDTSGPTAADVPPDARLVDATQLQAIPEPSATLDLVPRHILQRVPRRGRRDRLRSAAGLGSGAVTVHVLLGAAFAYLLSFRDTEAPREVEIPVEIVTEASKPAVGGTGAKADSGPAGGQQRVDVAGSGSTGTAPIKADPSPAAPTPLSPSPPAASKPGSPAAEAVRAPPAPVPARAPAPETAPASKPAPAVPRQAGVPAPPKLVAPPAEAARAATQAKENKPANRVPDEHQADQATREARPTAVPGTLVTADAKAQASVPAPSKAQPAPTDRPTPPVIAKAPSQADKLAAALPMDASGLPSPFRSVLAGNAAAQINAAYGGVVQGRIRQATAELSGAASARHLSGNVAVTFTLDDAGGLAKLSVAQSSGSAELDAMVLQAIERLAPFPPPPPEAEHTFNKAFLVGG